MMLYSGPLPNRINPQPIVNVEVVIALSKPDDHATRLLSLHQAIAKEATGMEVVPASHPLQGESNWFPLAETRLALLHSAATIRPDSIQLDYGPAYPGWPTVRDELWSIIQNLSPDLYEHIAELSLRYVNFFPSKPGVDDVVQIEATTPFGDATTRRWFRFQTEDGEVRHDITCAEGVSVENSDEHGVILDIASTMNSGLPGGSAVIESFDRLHDREKRAFMSMITSDYISTLEVVY